MTIRVNDTNDMSKHHNTLLLMGMIEAAKSTGSVFDAIQNAIRNNKPMGSILQELRDMYREAPQDTIKVFGQDIVNQLKKVI